MFYGFERVNPATLEEVENAGSALTTLAEKKDELSQVALVSSNPAGIKFHSTSHPRLELI